MILPFVWYDLHYLDLKYYKSETFPKILEFSPLVLKSILGHNWHIRTYHEFLLTELEWWLYKSQILFWHNDCGLTSYAFLESVILGLKMKLKKFNEGIGRQCQYFKNVYIYWNWFGFFWTLKTNTIRRNASVAPVQGANYLQSVFWT